MPEPSATSGLDGLRAGRFGPVRWTPEIDSTNQALLADARAGAPAGEVLVADHQTAGRGRLGRTWLAPPGAGLLVSILLRPADAELVPLLPAAVALAARAACTEVAGVTPDLKWPNDLLVDDRKVAGVLAESVVEGGRVTAVVVGIGLNVNWPPDFPAELAATATALNHVTGTTHDRVALLRAMLVQLDALLTAAETDPGTVVARYRAACATVGRQVRVGLVGGETMEGEAVAIGEGGALVVRSADGAEHLVRVGDVVHLRPRT